MFELTQKINHFIRLLLNHRTQSFAQGNALIELAQARLFAKNGQWLEASELYLEWISSNINSTSNAILREFFFCLAHTKNYDENCCIELGLHLLTKETHDKNPQILQIILKKYLQLQAPAEALSTLLHFFNKNQAFRNDTTLHIMHAEILTFLKRDKEAEIILVSLREPTKPSSEIDIQIELLAAKIDYLQKQPSKALNTLQSLFKYFPEHAEIKYFLALHHLKYGNPKEGEALLDSLKDQDEYFIDYLRHLFLNPQRYANAMEEADRRRLYSIKKDEIQSIQILQAFHHNDYELGKAIFDELLHTHHNPAALIPMLLEFIHFYEQFQDIAYYQTMLKSLYQTQEIPYSLQILTNRHISAKLYQHSQHRYPQLILPDFVHEIFQELWHPDYPNEELFLVGGAVLQLLKNIPLTPESDLDFIFISSRKEIGNYVPSRYIENLYVRDRKRLGGYAVDLKVITPDFSEKDILSENTLYRDYTICALFCNQQGVIFDPTGRALQDFEQKQLNTISNARSTLKEDPVRILRAFKYIARGYKTSPELEEALKEPLSFDFANHNHFNQVLLKECQSFKNIEFIQIMMQYDFFKYLDYCQIPESTLKSGMPHHVCQYLIQGLILHKEVLPLKRHYSKIHHELQTLETTLTQGIEDKTQKIQALQTVQAQLKLSNHELEKQFQIQKHQLQHAQILSQQQQEKLKKIQSLQQQIIKKQQINDEKQKILSELDETITAQYQEEFEKKSKELHALRSKFNHQGRKNHQEQQKYTQQLQTLKKTVEIQKASLSQNEELRQKNHIKQNFIQQVKTFFLSNPCTELPTYESEENIFSPIVKNEFRYRECPHPHALEQMSRIVCISDLKAYLHAHLAIRGLQLIHKFQNRFKIHYHLKSLMEFLPTSLTPLYQSQIDSIIAELDLPAINTAMKPKEYIAIAKESASELRIEEAIFYYQQGISLYAMQNKEKPYFDALVELAALHAKQYDFLQVEKILQKLSRIKKLSNEIQKQIQNIYDNIQISFQVFNPLSKREYTYQYFLDFWPTNLTSLSKLHTYTHIHLSLDTKKNIYENIIEYTLYEEEWMLAQIEYAHLLSGPSQLIQNSIIQSFKSHNPDIEILLEYAKFQGIPQDFHQFFANKDLMRNLRRRTMDIHLHELYLIHIDNFPYDEKTLKYLSQFKLCPSLADFVHFGLGLAYIKDGLVWEALFHLQNMENTPRSHYDFRFKIEEANLLKPELSWDCCDANAWFNYALKYPENQNLVMYCYYQTLRYNPYHYQALNALILLFRKQKNFQMILSTISLIEPIISYCNIIDKPSEQVFEYQKIKEQINLHIEEINAQCSAVKQNAPLNPVIKNTLFDLKKYQLSKALIWRRYHLTHDNETCNPNLMHQIIRLSITNDIEYTLAHFELARLLTHKNPILANYHFKEASLTWVGLLFMHRLSLHSNIHYPLSELKKHRCLMLYHDAISSEITNPQNQNPQFYLDHFQFLVETHWLHFLQTEHIQTFLALENLTNIQKIEGYILLGDYHEAKTLLTKESEFRIEQAPQRLFDFSPTENEMTLFFHQLWDKWSNAIMQLNHLKCQEFYLQKVIQLGEYLGKFTEIEPYQKMRSSA